VEEDSLVALEWTCATCGSAIADGQGYLTVSQTDIAVHADHRIERDRHAFREAEHAWQRDGAREGEWHLLPRGVSVGEVWSWPEPAHWRAVHESEQCDPRYVEGESVDYCVPVKEVRTWPSLIEWTAQLMEKTWLQDTNWDGFLRATLQRQRARISH
jgi:hypothetical protein